MESLHGEFPCTELTHWESQTSQKRCSVCFPPVLALEIRGPGLLRDQVDPQGSAFLGTSAEAKIIRPFLFQALGALNLRRGGTS